MIPLVKPYLPPQMELIPALEQVIYSGHIAQGPKVEEFEREMGAYVGNTYCVSVNSGSSALHLALLLAGVAKGDEVISTALTAEPTNTVIHQTGAKIVWADVDITTGNIDPKDVIEKITEKTKAIVVVDYAGMPVSIEDFQSIEKKYNIPVIQDSAHAFGAEFKNKKMGNHFSYTIYSFQAIKHFTTIDGGMLFVKSESDCRDAKLMRWFGLDKGVSRNENNIKLQGFKYHMNDVNATVGLVQLKHCNHNIMIHRSNGEFYDNNLSMDGIKLLKVDSNSRPSYWLYTLLVERREDFIQALNSSGIFASELHKRNDLHELFSDSQTRLPNLDLFENERVHIPCGWWVDEASRSYIVETIKKGW